MDTIPSKRRQNDEIVLHQANYSQSEEHGIFNSSKTVAQRINCMPFFSRYHKILQLLQWFKIRDLEVYPRIHRINDPTAALVGKEYHQLLLVNLWCPLLDALAAPQPPTSKVVLTHVCTYQSQNHVHLETKNAHRQIVTNSNLTATTKNEINRSCHDARQTPCCQQTDTSASETYIDVVRYTPDQLQNNEIHYAYLNVAHL